MVTATVLSPTERAALEGLTETSFWRTPWIDPKDFERAMAAYRDGRGLRLVVKAPIERVQAVFARAFKSGRRLLSVSMGSDGRFEEVWRSDAEVIPALPEAPYRGPDPPPVADATPPHDVEAAETAEPLKPLPAIDDPPAPPPPKVEQAVTVAQPFLGCPAPDFADVDKRAAHVLEQFLLADQREDWRRYGGFVSVGFETGHRYMLASRDARLILHQHGGRSLYDLDDKRAFCIHDWDVPAAEELLALHAFLSVPGGERFLRGRPAFHALQVPARLDANR